MLGGVGLVYRLYDWRDCTDAVLCCVVGDWCRIFGWVENLPMNLYIHFMTLIYFTLLDVMSSIMSQKVII